VRQTAGHVRDASQHDHVVSVVDVGIQQVLVPVVSEQAVLQEVGIGFTGIKNSCLRNRPVKEDVPLARIGGKSMDRMPLGFISRHPLFPNHNRTR